MNHHTSHPLIRLATWALLASATVAAASVTVTITQLTDSRSTSALQYEARDPDIAKDGSAIVFTANADVVPGSNPDHLDNLYIMASNGSALRQLTHATRPTTPVESTAYYTTSTPPRLSANGKVVVFASYFDLTGENPPEFFADAGYYLPNYQIFTINSDGSDLRQLTHGSGGHSIKPRISDDGQTIAFESTQDLIAGQNSDHTKEIFVIHANGTQLTQITHGVPYPTGRNIRSDDSRNVALSGDGSTLAFDSFNDLLPPMNDDWNNEVFLFDLAGYQAQGATFSTLKQYTTQITNTDVDAPVHIRAEDAFEPSLSYDGSWIAFSGCINPDGEGVNTPNRTVPGSNPFLADVIFIAQRSGGGLRQLTFSDNANAYTSGSGWRNSDDDAHWPEISAQGDKIVFSTRSRADLAAGSKKYELAMIDLNAPLNATGRPVVKQLTFAGTDSSRLRPSISADAKRITLHTSSNLSGGNSDLNSEIFLIESQEVLPATPVIEATPLTPPDEPDTNPDTIKEENTAPTDNAQNRQETTSGGGAFGWLELLLGISACGVFGRRQYGTPPQAKK